MWRSFLLQTQRKKEQEAGETSACLPEDAAQQDSDSSATAGEDVRDSSADEGTAFSPDTLEECERSTTDGSTENEETVTVTRSRVRGIKKIFSKVFRTVFRKRT